MRKTLLFACSVSLLVTTSKAQTWIELNSNFATQSEGVLGISVTDDNNAWVLGYDGTGSGANFIDFSRTTDGGNTFVTGTVGTDTTYQFSNISAINGDTAWVCMFNHVAGSGGGIWKTTDGGVSWNQQGVGVIYDANSFPDIVHFWDFQNGVTIGDPNNGYFEIWTTDDGGSNWARVPQANIPAAQSGEFGIVNWYAVYGDNIWFYTNKGRVFRSNDKGLTWAMSPMHNLTTTQFINLKFFDANNGISNIGTTGGAFVTSYKTTDGGVSWSSYVPTGNFLTSDLVVVPGTAVAISTGAATGVEGSSYSEDMGMSWIDIDAGVQHTSLGAYSFNSIYCGGFSGGFQSGGIFKWDGTVLGVSENTVDLRRNNLYPNPSNGRVTLNLKSKSNATTVQVIDAMGKLVFSQSYSGTIVKKSFDFSGLSKGVYSLVVISGNERSQEKLVIQ
ncbi:MAG: T9SS type A sorting domain-containing protein [Bacteroidetes bacterium]|nr:T9SS type A sorting domain-containing protein [Bacteroidota bacterium]